MQGLRSIMLDSCSARESVHSQCFVGCVTRCGISISKALKFVDGTNPELLICRGHQFTGRGVEKAKSRICAIHTLHESRLKTAVSRLGRLAYSLVSGSDQQLEAPSRMHLAAYLFVTTFQRCMTCTYLSYVCHVLLSSIVLVWLLPSKPLAQRSQCNPSRFRVLGSGFGARRAAATLYLTSMDFHVDFVPAPG